MRQPVHAAAHTLAHTLALVIAACILAGGPVRAAEREDPNLRRGRIHYRSGKYNEAINELRVALRRDNRNGEAHLWLGKAYARTSEFDKAIVHLQQAVAIRPDSEDGYTELGRAYLEFDTRARAKGETDRAREYIEKAENAAKTLLQRSPKAKESYEFLIKLSFHKARVFTAANELNKANEQFDQALEYCEKVLQIDPNDISTHLERITVLFDRKRFKDCERRCNEVLKINPALHVPKLTKARILRIQGDKQGAVEILSAILAEKKTQIEALLRRAEIYLDMQKYEEALADANEAIRLTNKNPYANFIRGCVYMQLKKLDAGIQELQQAATGMPRHLPSHFWLARCLLMKDRLREAVEELNTVTKLDPRFVVARLILASAHLQQGYPDGAISTLLDALHFEANNVEVRRLLGIAYLHKGEPERARSQFSKMLELDPEAARAHQVLAGLALSKGEVDQAIAHCREALQVEPKNVDVHFLLGLAYLKRRRLDGAKAQFEHVLRLRARHPGARMNLAAVHVQLREFDLAQEQYQSCVEEDPTLAKPRYNLARLYILQRKYDKAEAELTQLLKIESEKAKAHLAMAELHRAKGEKDRAIQAAKTALSQDGKLLQARVFLAHLYMVDQNWPNALAELEAALTQNAKFLPAYEAGVIQFFLGRYDEAVKIFEKAVHNDIHKASSYAAIAAALQLRGDFRGALANINQADDNKPQDPLVSLQQANIFLAQGDADNARTLVRQCNWIPEVIRDAYLSFIENFVNDKARSRAVSDALTRVIFYGSRGWHEQAEQNCNLLLKLAPDNTFAYTVLANVYLATRKPEKEIGILKRLIDVAPKDHRHRVRLGKRLLGVGRFKDALGEFQKAIQVDPKAVEPRIQLGAYYLKMAQYDQAAEEARKALAVDASSSRALALLAACQLREENYEEAKETLTRLTKDPKVHKGALPFIQIAELDLLDGKVDKAIAQYKDAVEANPKSLHARMGLGQAFLRRASILDAVEQFKEVLAIDATYSPALLALARVHRSTNRLDLALEYCERARGVNPSSPAIRYELAAIRFAQKKYGDAVAVYERILKEKPNDYRARIGIAQCQFESGERAAAIAQLTELLKRQHPLPPARSVLVAFYKRTGEIDKAQAELETLVKTTAPRLMGAYDLAVLYVHKDRLDPARQLVDAALKAQPGNLGLQLALGVVLQLKGELPAAVNAFEKVRAANPKHARLAAFLANTYLAQGKAAEARKAMDSVELSPEIKAAYGKLITGLSAGGDAARLAANGLNQAALYADATWLTLARDRYIGVLKALPKNLAVMHLLASVYERLDDKAKCIEIYKEMLVIAPGYEPALRSLAAHHVNDEDFQAAAGVYRGLLEGKPDNVGLQLALATIVQRMGNTDEAIDLYKKIIKQSPNNPIAYNNLAWIYATVTKDLKMAEDLATKASDLTKVDSPSGAAIRDTLAWVFYLTERYDKALEHARAAVRGMPGSAEVHYHLGMIYFKRNLRASAARHLIAALRLDPEFEQKEEVDKILDRIRQRKP